MKYFSKKIASFVFAIMLIAMGVIGIKSILLLNKEIENKTHTLIKCEYNQQKDSIVNNIIAKPCYVHRCKTNQGLQQIECYTPDKTYKLTVRKISAKEYDEPEHFSYYLGHKTKGLITIQSFCKVPDNTINPQTYIKLNELFNKLMK